MWRLSKKVSDTNFFRILSFADILILASQIMVFDTSYSTKQGITQCFDQEYKRIPRKGVKGSFWDFSRPWLAQDSI